MTDRSDPELALPPGEASVGASELQRRTKEAAIAEELRERDRRMIRALLRKPMNKRTNFLRRRLPDGGSCL